MKRFVKYGLISLFVNSLALASVFIVAINKDGDAGIAVWFYGIILFGFLILVQVITGLVLTATPDRKELGQGLLLGVGLLVLIGTSFCGGIFMLN